MKRIVTLLFLLISIFGFGQQINAPDPKSFTQSTAGQDASGFTISGFGTTDVLLCAIGLPNTVTGTTFYFTTTSGVTPASGYTMSGNKTRLAFTGTQSNINSVLASMKINTAATAGDINISVSATLNPTGYYYNPTNGHFYRPVSTGANFANAITLSANQTFKGQTGYLVTITSADEDAFIFNNVPQSNIWFALDDRTTEGRWVISAGPEVNTLLNIGNYNANPQPNTYRNWANGEPNDWGGNEDAAVTKWGGGSQWNDLSTANVNPYVVEFGTWTNPDDQTFTQFYNNAVTHTNGPDLSLKALFMLNFGGNIDETKFSATLQKRSDTLSAWTTGTYKALNGLGKVYLSNELDTAKVFTNAIQAATQNDMTAYTTSDIGKIYKMTITGASGGGWGTDIYTNDSYIPAMAVHAGVIAIGQTKEVYIKIVEGLNDYPSSTRNGITTMAWGSWGLSYQFVSQPSSYKATINPGQAEFSYTNPNAGWLNGDSRLLIDMRMFNGILPSTVSKVKILDAYDGNVTFLSSDAAWAQYRVPSPLTKVTDGTSIYNANIRNVNGWNTDYAFTSTVNFSQIGTYKQHKLVFQNYDSVQLKSLYGNIVTVSDVYLAFKELANGGIFGNQSGNEFGYGIQFDNADVDDNGVFNEADCFRLLQDLTGVRNLVSSYTLDNTMKLVPDTTYESIGKSNWAQFPSYLGKEFAFSLIDGKTNYTYNLAVTWKGDVNLSHSATPPANGITNMSANFGDKVSSMSVGTNQMGAEIISELIGDSVIVEINFNTGENNIVGTQFKINYDNSLLKFSKTEYTTNGTPTNYSADRNNYINVGSLNTDGAQITSAKYKLIFTTKQKLNGALGVISIGNSEAVSKDGKSLVIKIQ
jgi:hypothetical protein